MLSLRLFTTAWDKIIFYPITLIYRLRESFELNIPKSLLSRAVKSNCLGLSCPDTSAGNSGWCFELPRMWGFHPYHFCLLHSAPWPSNMIWNSVLPLTALTATSTKTIPYFLAKNSVRFQNYSWSHKKNKLKHKQLWQLRGISDRNTWWTCL